MMAPMLWLALALFLCAVVLAVVLSSMATVFMRKEAVQDPVETDLPHLSLVIAARNAGSTLPLLLQDIRAQSYPRERTEVIVVDDASEDDTFGIATGMQRNWKELQVMKADGVGKKAAITTGVARSTGDLVLLTDADGRCGPDRLATLARHWRSSKADLVLMPVRTISEGGPLGRLQEDEQAALLGIGFGGASMGWRTMAYGANLAFTRAAFHGVGGYDGDRYASGDDVFLLQRMRAAGRTIEVLLDPCALVTVSAERSWSAFVSQRIRWAGKMKGAGIGVQLIGLLVMAMPFALLWASLSFKPVQAMGEQAFQTTALLIASWCLLLVPVLRLVGTVRCFLGQSTSLPIAFLSYSAFTVYAPVIAIVSRFVRPLWKGRRIR